MTFFQAFSLMASPAMFAFRGSPSRRRAAKINGVTSATLIRPTVGGFDQTMSDFLNIYCDESCHLERDNIPVMALGAVWCRAARVQIDRWENASRGEARQLLWFREEFLIVLAARIRTSDGAKYWQLLTAYDTPREHTKRKLRKERDTPRP